MKTLEDEAAQIHGIVTIGNYQGLTQVPPGLTDFMANGGPILMTAIPFRPASFHFCLDSDNLALKSLASFTQMILGRYLRLRFLTHIGQYIVARARGASIRNQYQSHQIASCRMN